MVYVVVFFFSSRRRHTRSLRDWSSDVCSSDLQRERDLESLRARSRLTLTTVGLVAGPFLLGLGCLAWSLFRTLQRFSLRMTHLAYGPMFYWSDAAVLGASDGRASAVMKQMEQ